jgi:hypothetical protein
LMETGIFWAGLLPVGCVISVLGERGAFYHGGGPAGAKLEPKCGVILHG